MNAKEARELAKSVLDKKTDEIIIKVKEKISVAASTGKFYIFVNEITEDVKEYFELNGFVLKPTASVSMTNPLKYKISWR